jgi:hypothetical protein
LCGRAAERARQEVRIVRPDRRVVDAERAGGTEADASVERGFAQQDEQWPSARFGLGDERLHERGADALALMRRRHADRCHAGDAARGAVKAAGRRQRVRHHRAGLIGHQLDERCCGACAPRPTHDGELLVCVPGVVSERSVDHVEDLRLVIGSSRGAHEHAHGSRTPTLIM